MAKEEITEIVKQYVEAARTAGIPVSKAILFGSHAQNKAHEGSDIDVLVISPEFDKANQAFVDLLWELRATTDARIEPVAGGLVRWETDRGTWLLQKAREEGIIIL